MFIPAFETFGEGPKRAFILHGILASARNWRGFARRLVGAHPDYTFVGVDLRSHGESEAGPAPHSLAACAEDLLRLAEQTGMPEVVIGHSFGGKVALCYGQLAPMGLRAVWSLDSNPAMAKVGGAVEGVIRLAAELPMPVASRDVVEAFAQYGKGVAAWMTTNLRRVDAGFEWRFHVPGVLALIEDYAQTDLWPWLADPGLDVHLLWADRGLRYSAEDQERVAQLPVRGYELPEAGHWVHIDQPEALAALIGETL